MANIKNEAYTNSEDDLRIDTELELDDEMCNLFSAFDEVSASDELQDAALARIFANNTTATVASDTPSLSRSPEVKAVAGDKPRGAARRAKWRAIRVAAIAACLALALGGGVAYATPATYYEVEQGSSKVTLGVNLFGVTVAVEADDDAAREIVDSTDLANMPYEQSLARAVEQMEERNPAEPVEFGPRGGEHEFVPAAQEPAPADEGGNGADAPNGEGVQGGEGAMGEGFQGGEGAMGEGAPPDQPPQGDQGNDPGQHEGDPQGDPSGRNNQ